MSTSRVVLLRKLRERGHSVLADAAEAGTVSAFAAAQFVGIVRERDSAGNGSQNVAKANAWRIHQILRGVEDPDGAAKPVAEDVKAPDRPPEPTLTPGGCGPLPCMTCSAAVAALARQEIADVWAANQMGDGSRRPNPFGALPRACCRRGQHVMCAAALIG